MDLLKPSQHNPYSKSQSKTRITFFRLTKTNNSHSVESLTVDNILKNKFAEVQYLNGVLKKNLLFCNVESQGMNRSD